MRSTERVPGPLPHRRSRDTALPPAPPRPRRRVRGGPDPGGGAGGAARAHCGFSAAATAVAVPSGIRWQRRKTTVKTLCIYADYKSDESYTPSKISVRVGNNFHNLQEIRQLELVEPSGWIHVPLTDTHKKPIRTFMIQIAVLANHQNGRDTHMRQIKVYTPVEESSIGKFPRCTTIDFMMYRSIR
ncbi:anaphase-promoting complex subunit 10 isoform X2 [Pyrgilauda ruficollis]|uniref:anaphase-promoting complex subunit 10 isoform X2 n=1 Tax=Pyrgilauda ruficollis TaxID=221976 RepID=UPI001B878339|nr:anaphase-promoting complex subunit 10 isoform X2 [Pyrgilauda ruficollis]